MAWHQWLLLIPGVAAIALSFVDDPRMRRWSPVLGLLSQPGWFIAAWLSQQPAVLIMTACYCCVWIFGFRKLWWPQPRSTFETSVEAMLDVAFADEDFLEDVRRELHRARSSKPDDQIITVSLTHRYAELCMSAFEDPTAKVRKRAVLCAAAAASLIRGDDEWLNAWRSERGLDPLVQP